ncbi:hypothetical protein RRG08_053318 [Elysia crispata]|uniref:Uncharacterized protein n=1 Tax=Elysia crispata TaxID=231223 RepID=A0AAE0ZLM2_9GAST|nr:hypothetical protein RRG08_053318 [Elysia crispata]
MIGNVSHSFTSLAIIKDLDKDAQGVPRLVGENKDNELMTGKGNGRGREEIHTDRYTNSNTDRKEMSAGNNSHQAEASSQAKTTTDPGQYLLVRP